MIVLALAAALSAQHFDWFTDVNGENSGHTACGFLNLPRSAAALGRGIASSPGGMDATDLPDFTANSALLERYCFAFTHLEWLMGMRKEYLGALFPLLDIGTFGGYAQVFTPGAIDNARDIDEQPSDPKYVEYSIGASYARGFFDNQFSAGCALAFVESRIEELAGRTVSGSVDLRYAPFSFVSTHFAATSFGKAVSYSGSTAEPLPAEVMWSVLLEPLPADLPLKKLFDFDIGIGVRKTSDEPVIAGISTEIATGIYFRLRAGYEYTKGASPSVNGLSLGAGIEWNSFDLDGGWRYLSNEFGPVWALSVAYEREELKKRTAEDYYEIAVKYYKKRRYTLCTINAKRALRLDPNMWKAHALLSRVKSDILRSKRREIAIIYTGNAQGNFTIPFEEGVPGGFARQASVIASLRGQFPLAVAIEAGNMVTPQMQQPRLSFVGSYLDHIAYDAIGCGAGELVYGIPKVLKTASSHPQFICANVLSTPSGVVRHRIIEREGYRFFVASYINPSILPEGSRPLLRPLDGAELQQAAKDCDLRILIAHDSWEQLSASRFAGFDIIICGNLEQRFPSPMKLGKCIILSAGSRGRYVGNLIVRFDENRHVITMENRLIPLQSGITPDTAVARNIAAFSTAAATVTPSPGVRQPSEGTFVFISDRDGKVSIYLKVTDRMAEFPLTRSIADTCDHPVLSFAAGRIACRASADSCRRLLVMRSDGTGPRYVADGMQVRDASFTPDGVWLYYAAAPCGDTVTDLYRVKSEGGPSFAVIAWPQATETAPVFSTDGSMMLFGSDRDGTMQLYLTNPQAEQPLRITDEAANHTSPAFSPDGAFIAYLSDATNFRGRRDLWLFERNGGTHRRITQRS
ncbi:MAG: PD40 domain-containing protein, partial [Chitinispirillaceae bacterium]|nr:PD40 domain-containing protein [Chitinispirillaceae bacterium]